ncbi:MAG: ATP-binding protein [Thermoleophilia bacterium]|nr:ATP-binding protein [Thermoleophilia bacterium]
MFDENPFTFGNLALDEAFIDREAELEALLGDLRSGQDVLLVAPRRYGKSSLALRAVRAALEEDILVASCDLMRTPTKQRFAAALAKTIHDDLTSSVDQARDRAAGLFRGLRIRPTIELDPDDGDLSFSFRASRAGADLDATIERLLGLPGRIAAERNRRVAIVFDEFQEVVGLDPKLPNLMRSVFQGQPHVAHVYLGSKRHAMQSIFNDRNEPFWRNARQMQLGRLPEDALAEHIRDRFRATERDADDEAVWRILAITDGHPYATQELAFFAWGHVPLGHAAHESDVEAGLIDVLNAEHNNLSRLWDGCTRNERVVLLALRGGPLSLFSEEVRERTGLPAATFVQRAVKALVRDDTVEQLPDKRYQLAEPFLAEWLDRDRSTRMEH